MRKRLMIVMCAVILVTGGSQMLLAYCSCTATSDKEATCSGEGYTPCNGASCEFTIECCPPALKISCSSSKYYCSTGYTKVDAHEKCDKTGQAGLECYQDGDYYIKTYKNGTCGTSGECNAPTEDENDRQEKDDYNTRPCSP